MLDGEDLSKERKLRHLKPDEVPDTARPIEEIFDLRRG
jgi:hypothetical protein